MTVRVWRCRKTTKGIRCDQLNPRRKQRCTKCGGPRPKPRTPAHRRVLSEMPYSEWVEIYGEVCGICGREPTAKRRLDRDHDHKTGKPRGLLCALCNRALPNHINVAWLAAAIAYLERAEAGDFTTERAA